MRTYLRDSTLVLYPLALRYNIGEFGESKPMPRMRNPVTTLNEGRVRMRNIYRLSDFLDWKIG
jgi:hypothetical protein